MTSPVPEGFRRVTFAVISETEDQLAVEVSCLMCSVCQALILQNNFNDYVEAHRKWHENLLTCFSLTTDLIQMISGVNFCSDDLDTPADWEQMGPIIPPKRR